MAAVRVREDEPHGWNLLGNVLDELGDSDGALAAYDKALELEPASPGYLQNRAVTHRRRGEIEAALADYAAAIELDPESVGPYANRAYLYIDAREWEKALADADRAVGCAPDYWPAYLNRGQAKRRLGDTDGAFEDFLVFVSHADEEAAARFLGALAGLGLLEEGHASEAEIRRVLGEYAARPELD